jgi:putative FmdB family regulatory protein
MPVYEYECSACGHRFEEWQKITDKPVKVCPKCKARKVERLISQTSFQLKGGGWYGDLYSSAKGGSGSSSGGSSSSSPSSESKTATSSAESPSKSKGSKKSKPAA